MNCCPCLRLFICEEYMCSSLWHYRSLWHDTPSLKICLERKIKILNLVILPFDAVSVSATVKYECQKIPASTFVFLSHSFALFSCNHSGKQDLFKFVVSILSVSHWPIYSSTQTEVESCHWCFCKNVTCIHFSLQLEV